MTSDYEQTVEAIDPEASYSLTDLADLLTWRHSDKDETLRQLVRAMSTGNLPQCGRPTEDLTTATVRGATVLRLIERTAPQTHYTLRQAQAG